MQAILMEILPVDCYCLCFPLHRFNVDRIEVRKGPMPAKSTNLHLSIAVEESNGRKG